MKWILEQNAKGLQVKDHYISKMALKLLEQLRTTEDNPDENQDNLKPLNVAMNKSYQFDYGTRYDQYLVEVLTNVDMQTKAGNPRVPPVKLVSEWALDWIKHCKEENIAKAFKELEDIFNDYDAGDIMRGQMVAGALAVFATSNLEG
ncbi:unnamed protein product [Calypogeia fissa]